MTSSKREEKKNMDVLLRPKVQQMPKKYGADKEKKCDKVPECFKQSQTQLCTAVQGKVHQPWLDMAKKLFIPPAIMQKGTRSAKKGQNMNQGGNMTQNQTWSSESHSSPYRRKQRSLYDAVVKKLCQNTEEDEGFLPYDGQFKEFIEKGLDLISMAPLERSSLKNILQMVPTHLKKLTTPLEQLLREINDQYFLAVKRASVEYTFKCSKINEEKKAIDLPPHRLELQVYPKPWRGAFIEAQAQLMESLHAFNPVTQKTLSLWYDKYQDLRVIDVEDFHNRKDPIELSVFQTMVSFRVDRVKRILNNWLLDVQDIYYEASRKLLVPLSSKPTNLQSFFNSLAVLMTSQLQEFALFSLRDYTSLISLSSGGAYRHPGFVLHLVLKDNEIRIDPEFRLYEEAFLNVFELILSSASTVPRVDTFLLPDWTDLDFERNLKPQIQSEVVQAQMEEVREVVSTESIKPRECITDYDKYATLVSGEAEEDVKNFLSRPYTFQEILANIVHYQNLAEQIQYTSAEVVQYGMFEVQSHKLVNALVERTKDLQQKLTARILQDHQDINKKLCDEFENISRKMIIPSDMQELMELKEFINEVETTEMPVFHQRLLDSNKQLRFLMDSVSLSPSHLQLNAQTNQLFESLPPIFEKHKHIMNTTIEQYQSGMKGASPP
ncbi:dynein heavy chain 7, axonemal-like isoform X1 [Takifugu rubripes]|nr:dynein heavy chain 7, axonemal isoform X1 [Takifugu rubripes]